MKHVVPFFQWVAAKRPRFKYPYIVQIATIIAAATIWLTLHHHPWIDKTAFQLAMGFGVLFLTASSLAIKQGAGNTATYILFLGFKMLLFGITFTQKESLAGLAVEAIVPQILGIVRRHFHECTGQRDERQR